MCSKLLLIEFLYLYKSLTHALRNICLLSISNINIIVVHEWFENWFVSNFVNVVPAPKTIAGDNSKAIIHPVNPTHQQLVRVRTMFILNFSIEAANGISTYHLLSLYWLVVFVAWPFRIFSFNKIRCFSFKHDIRFAYRSIKTS